MDVKRRATSPYVPSGHHVFRVAGQNYIGFRVVPPRGGGKSNGHLVIGPMSINLYSSMVENLYRGVNPTGLDLPF
jgi:hypothetical protein